MILRDYWLGRLKESWRQAPVLWLSGVRRVGKTTLSKSLESARYINCDLPSAAARLEDPEGFFASVAEPIVVLDEIHQLPDPSRVLKIAADAFPKLKVLATGSSTLAATLKFRDSLTGRKRAIHLLPVLAEELPSFGIAGLERRLLHGGLPEALLADEPNPEFYAEWMDSYYARDIQELFRVEKRAGFLRLLEGLLRQSGGLMEVTSLAKICGLSRPTILNYLEVLQLTHAIHVLRPFHGGGKGELLHQPKVYAFDTGFVAYARSWDRLRPDDCGPLWEHLVLETLLSLSGPRKVHFWRDKQGREVDFVLPRGRDACDAIECKWSAAGFESKSLVAFRGIYPKGRSFLVAPLAGEPYSRKVGGIEVTFTGLPGLRPILDRLK